MAEPAITQVGRTDRTGLTHGDLHRLPDDGRRYELVDGRLFVTPEARRRHQWVVLQVARRLASWTDEHGGTVYPGVNVDLAADTHLEPDVAYSSSEDTSGPGFREAPELVVEVSSPATRQFDLGEKKDRYARAGAAEFWFVDLDNDRVLQFTEPGGGFATPAVHARGTEFTSSLFPDLHLDVDDLLGPPPDAGRAGVSVPT